MGLIRRLFSMFSGGRRRTTHTHSHHGTPATTGGTGGGLSGMVRRLLR